MKAALIVILMVLILTCCRKTSIISLKSSNKNKAIALQPLGEFDARELLSLQNELSSFFNIHVIILEPLEIPKIFRDHYEESCNADSLIQLLTKSINDTVVEVVGLTHQEIYTQQELNIRYKNKDTVVQQLKIIFGLGYVSEGSCIVSDYRLISTDRALWDNRVRKVVLHEIGHNLGLQHCDVDTCIMSETNGNLEILNRIGGDYCNKCRRKLNW